MLAQVFHILGVGHQGRVQLVSKDFWVDFAEVRGNGIVTQGGSTARIPVLQFMIGLDE